MSTLPPDLEEKRNDPMGRVASGEGATQGVAPQSARTPGVRAAVATEDCAEISRQHKIAWSPPPANDTADGGWSLLALVDDFAVLAADLYLRGRLIEDECTPAADLGKESDDSIV